MIAGILSLYLPSYPTTLIYMLQSSEYQISPYLHWYWRTKNFNQVVKRRQLEPTKAARWLLVAVRLGIICQIALGLMLMYLGIWQSVVGATTFGAAIIIAYPVTWAHLVLVPIALGRLLISQPAAKQAIEHSAKTFAAHQGVKIAVAGSYGKTTMKEILTTVLSEGKKVAATPGNKNVSTSHAQFARRLTGDEDILIIEYGEGEPGDVARFAEITKPTHAVITGIAPAHLDKYKTLRAAGEDIFSVADRVKPDHVYVNGDSPAAQPFIKSKYQVFNNEGTLGWKTSNIKTSLEGTTFELKKGKKTLKLKSDLISEYKVGYLAFAAALGLELGLSQQQVIDGIAATKPFEHRMQPYRLNGAWVVDDTYNGNLEGIKAGTQLLRNTSAKRKIYVTPGLVDQGEETEPVHLEVGRLIAEAKPDLVVLMKNSVTDFIKQGLREGKFAGELRIEPDPLDFYNNLTHFVAAGDLVVMQNDWTDNYT